MKFCCICKTSKSFTDFYRAKTAKDGCQTYCKLCNHLRRRTKTSEQRLIDNRKSVERNHKLRLEALTFYSNNSEPKCACCGETQYEFLALDHVNNDGSIHR